MHTKALMIQNYARHMIAICAAAIIVAAFLYGTFLLLAVERTATRAKADAQATAIASELGLLQSQYLAQTQTLTPALAAELGFVTPKSADIAYVDTNTRALSLNNVNNAIVR